MALTFVTAIPAALILYDPVLNETDYILGSGDDTRITLGAPPRGGCAVDAFLAPPP